MDFSRLPRMSSGDDADEVQKLRREEEWTRVTKELGFVLFEARENWLVKWNCHSRVRLLLSKHL